MAKEYGRRWVVVESLGEGGQAHIFRVRDKSDASGKEYALKRLKNDARIARFGREIDAIKSLDHPGIVRIEDYSLELPEPFYVMELALGGSLEGRLPGYKGFLEDSLRLLALICDAVAAAHGAGIIHRDLKPGNILFRTHMDPRPVVADFGLCWLEDGKRFTASEEAVGSRHFTAPELESGRAESVTPAADIYSLGKLLYYIITGGRLLPREDLKVPGYDLLTESAKWNLSTAKRAQMEYAMQLLDRMVKRDPLERAQSIAELRKTLDGVLEQVSGGFYPLSEDMPCKFCGAGRYRQHSPRDESFALSTNTRNFPEIRVRVLECDSCGHTQFFSPYKFPVRMDPGKADVFH